jgi:RNA polymerase sigma factor (sigma-70 family)
MTATTPQDTVAADLAEKAKAAAAGDKTAAEEVLAATQDDVYALALRMLAHPADAEDAAQEILVIVLTHLGSFRGESSFRTWVWRIAANHLARVRRGRREVVTFDVLGERLRTGLREEASTSPDPERETLAKELRLRCTEAMLVSLDRDLRIAYVLSDIFLLPSEEGAEVLEIEPAAFRKRVSRARERLYEFVGSWCGVYAQDNPCRCNKQVDAAVEHGLLDPSDLYMSRQRMRPHPARLARAADEVTELYRIAETMRGPSSPLAPSSLTSSMRALVRSDRLELLRR